MHDRLMTEETREALLDVLLAAELRIYREFKYAESEDIDKLKAEIDIIRWLEHETKALYEKDNKQ